MKKRFVVGLAKYGLGLGLLAFVIWRNWMPSSDGSSPGLVGVFQQPIRWVPLFWAFVLCLASILLTFLRWYWLVLAQKLPCTAGNALRLGLIGFFLSTFLPGSVGGDIIKAACIARQQRRRTVAVATVIVDRLVGLWALFWLVALLGSGFWLLGDAAVVQQPGLQTMILGSLGLVVATSLCWGLLLLLSQETAQRLAERLETLPKVGHSLAELWRAVWMYRNQWHSVLAALLLSLVSHCGFVLTFYYSAQTFAPTDQLPSLEQHFLIVPVGLTVQALFPSPGGVGGGEWGFESLYHLVGQPRVNGIMGSLTQRMIMWVLGFLGYLLYLRMRAEVVALQAETLVEQSGATEPASSVEPPAAFRIVSKTI